MHTPHPDNPVWIACQPIVAEILDELDAMEWPLVHAEEESAGR